MGKPWPTTSGPTSTQYLRVTNSSATARHRTDQVALATPIVDPPLEMELEAKNEPLAGRALKEQQRAVLAGYPASTRWPER